jgi:hypothetical protein
MKARLTNGASATDMRVMTRRSRVPPEHRLDTGRSSYALVVGGRDGRPRVERFDDAASYRVRLAALGRSRGRGVSGVSVQEIVRLLDS